MKTENTLIQDSKLFTPTIFEDNRGFFLESYNQIIAKTLGQQFVQENISLSQQGVLRGLHLQEKPNEQGKLIQVLQGSIWDVIVDLRKESSSYLKWQGFRLDDKWKRQLWIPPGLAHGFVSLEPNTLIQYKCTHYYAPENEITLRWDDPTLQINWGKMPERIISEKDKQGISLQAYLKNREKKVF